MLTTCWECEQVLEIQLLNEHLTSECQFSNKYTLHDNCKRALHQTDLKTHKCVRPRPAGAVKCPLCQESVFPNTNSGWRKHILLDKCTANSRK